MSDTVIRAAASALNPDRPIVTLAGLARAPRSTVKSWATGRRRPSVVILKALRDRLKDHQVALFQLIAELDSVILQREREQKRRTGFNEIKACDGPGSVPRDGRNRFGRPSTKRVSMAR